MSDRCRWDQGQRPSACCPLLPVHWRRGERCSGRRSCRQSVRSGHCFQRCCWTSSCLRRRPRRQCPPQHPGTTASWHAGCVCAASRRSAGRSAPARRHLPLRQSGHLDCCGAAPGAAVTYTGCQAAQRLRQQQAHACPKCAHAAMVQPQVRAGQQRRALRCGCPAAACARAAWQHLAPPRACCASRGASPQGCEADGCRPPRHSACWAAVRCHAGTHPRPCLSAPQQAR